MHNIVGITETSLDPHHVDGKLHKHIDVILVYILHPAGCQHGQTRAVRDIIDGGQLMLHAVAGPILLAPHANQAVMSDGSAKAKLTPGIIVIGVVQRLGRVFHQSFQNGLA